METFVLVIHALTALFIVGLVLVQQGKGAAMGAAFGSGASQTVFGSEGSGNFFTRATWILATVFFCTSFGLAVIAKNHSKVATEGLVVPAVQQEIPVAPATDVPAATEVPAAEVPAADVPASDVPSSTQSE